MNLDVLERKNEFHGNYANYRLLKCVETKIELIMDLDNRVNDYPSEKS